MKYADEEDHKQKIIQDYLESKKKIREAIAQCKAQETTHFQIMLDRLQQSEEPHSSRANYFRSEQYRSLD